MKDTHLFKTPETTTTTTTPNTALQCFKIKYYNKYFPFTEYLDR